MKPKNRTNLLMKRPRRFETAPLPRCHSRSKRVSGRRARRCTDSHGAERLCPGDLEPTPQHLEGGEAPRSWAQPAPPPWVPQPVAGGPFHREATFTAIKDSVLLRPQSPELQSEVRATWRPLAAM